MTDVTGVTTSLRDDELRAIGLVAQKWAAFEGMLALTIAALLGAREDKGTIVGVAMGSRLAIEVAMSLASTALSQQDADLLVKVLKKAKTLQGKRNDCVHIIWQRSESDQTKMSPTGMKVREKITIASGDETAQSFEQTASEIQSLTLVMKAFVQEHFGGWLGELLKRGGINVPT